MPDGAPQIVPKYIYGLTLDELYDAITFAELCGWQPREARWRAVFEGPQSEYATLKKVAMALGFEALEGKRK